MFRFQVFWIECLAAIGVVPEDRLGGVDAKAQTMIGGMYLMGRGALLWNFGVPDGRILNRIARARAFAVRFTGAI